MAKQEVKPGSVEGWPSNGLYNPSGGYPFISAEADEALERIFAHPDGISATGLARAMRLVDCAFLIEELGLAGIKVREEQRGARLFYLAPLYFKSAPEDPAES